MLGLPLVVEFLTDARPDLARDLGRIDRRVHAAVDGEQPLELLQIGFDRRLHIGILQFAGERRAVMGLRPVHLPERSGGRRLVFELGESALPVDAEFGGHAPLHERPTHWRRIVLQLGEFLRIFRRQQIRHRRHQLGDLHDRPLQTAQCSGQFCGPAGVVAAESKQAGGGHPRSDTAHVGADPRITGCPGGKPVRFAIAGRQVLDLRTGL